ncbi:CidA/LrgA family protein [Raoultella planticola]|uniref:CidA/LrgA family protein n=1 Tax=Raoultella planticola TaxID=575 RepID=A0A443VEY3_RAOPL|nr:CidA/LrgA family protein [Raoultella planticola]RWT15794.1 CidA/LrgA family protein [Raoultella planticola]
MVKAFALLVVAQLLGELLRNLLHLPLPGPVIGMFILALFIILRGANRISSTPDNALKQLAEGLINNMGLLFVPAGVGIITEGGILREYWLPILIGLVFSTILGLIVTGLVMHHFSRKNNTQSETTELPE